MTNNIKKILTGRMLREGAGVKLTRFIGPEHSDCDPFLLFDYFDSSDPLDFIAGFPPHPHRGFETITYLLSGEIEHQDNKGHKGVIQAGDVQWMTAGRGIVHSEMPKASERLWGIQLWLNLPAHDKMIPPRYQEFSASQLPSITMENGIQFKIIAGKVNEIESPLVDIATQPLFFDILLPPKQTFSYDFFKEEQVLVFILQGAIELDQEFIAAPSLVQMHPIEKLTLQSGADPTRIFLLRAKRLNETVVRLGPFVMNTKAEILQAVEDFKNNEF